MKRTNFLRFNLKLIAEIGLTLSILIAITLSFKWFKFNNHNKSIDILVSKTNVIENKLYENYLNNLWCGREISYSSFIDSIKMHPYIKAARVSMHYPNKIRVEIIEREPIAYLKTDPMIFLDKEGYVLPSEENIDYINLPILTNVNPDKNLYPIGKKVISEKIAKCISLLSTINNQHKDLYENISEMKMSSKDELEIILSDEPTHIFLGKDNINLRVNQLVEFSKLLKPRKLSHFKYLDMRFQNQIIAKERAI
jgi:cell division septal protein FtsQ